MEGIRSSSPLSGQSQGHVSSSHEPSTSGIQIIQPKPELSVASQEKQQRKRHLPEASERYAARKTRRLSKPEKRSEKKPITQEQEVRELLSDNDFLKKLNKATLSLFKELTNIMFDTKKRGDFITGAHKVCALFTKIVAPLEAITSAQAKPSQAAAIHFLDKLFEHEPGVDWKEVWKYIPKTKKEKNKFITYFPPDFMEKTQLSKNTLVSIYTTYNDFIHIEKNKSILEFKTREPECFRLLAALSRDSDNNFRALMPMLSETQRWVFKEWLDSVSQHTKDSALVWRNMTPELPIDSPLFRDDSNDDEPEEKCILRRFDAMENALKEIKKMSKYELQSSIPNKEIHPFARRSQKSLSCTYGYREFS